MKNSWLIAAFFCLIAAYAAYPQKIVLKKVGGYDIPASFKRCEADSDCVAIEDICGPEHWRPLNKKYLSELPPYSSDAVNCIHDTNPKPQLACALNFCTAKKP